MKRIKPLISYSLISSEQTNSIEKNPRSRRVYRSLNFGYTIPQQFWKGEWNDPNYKSVIWSISYSLISSEETHSIGKNLRSKRVYRSLNFGYTIPQQFWKGE